MRFGKGILRFKPDGSELEFIRSSNNTWGLGLTEDNIIIGSAANGNASMYMPIANRFYEAVNGWSAARIESIASSQSFFPITDQVRQVDYHGRYTAGCGSAIYTARSFPNPFWNRAQFVAEPTGHLLGLFFLNRDGADFSAQNARNLLASDDGWSSQSSNTLLASSPADLGEIPASLLRSGRGAFESRSFASRIIT